MGKVRGFRVWTMRLVLRPIASLALSRNDYTGWKGYTGWGRDHSTWASYLPERSGSVEGMYGGQWNKYSMREGWYHASCRDNTCRRPPSPGCGCGFWAHWNTQLGFFTPQPWIKKRRNPPGEYWISIPLCGVIDGSGATIIGDKGFRTERARITDLAVPLTTSSVIEEEPDPTEEILPEPDPWGVITTSSISLTAIKYHPQQPVARFLAEELDIPEAVVIETIYGTAESALGIGFKWHGSPEALAVNCHPDENYGSP